MDLKRLRDETAAEHAATEQAVPLMGDSLTRAEYAGVLRGFFAVVSTWDRWADAHVPADLAAMLASRRRATLLADDLRTLGEAPDTAAPASLLERMEQTVVAGDPRSSFLGRMYVMEGSTLGGQYLARHVETTLGLAPGVGNSYFHGYGVDTGLRWREFKAVLADLPEGETDTVIASARNMFSLFGEGMQQYARPVHETQPVLHAG